MRLGCQQRTDVAVEDEIGLHTPFDRLEDVRVRGVHELAHLMTDVALPLRQGVDVVVHARVGLMAHATIVTPTAPDREEPQAGAVENAGHRTRPWGPGHMVGLSTPSMR